MGDREGDDGEGGNGVGRPVASGGSGGSHDPPPPPKWPNPTRSQDNPRVIIKGPKI